jgi:hypothetical protein
MRNAVRATSESKGNAFYIAKAIALAKADMEGLIGMAES